MAELTIITITYNDLVNLKRTIESVIRQLVKSNGDVEYLIIDGGSTDGTAEYLKGGVKAKYNIEFISEKDEGIYDAMNKGLRKASGNWIYYLNSSDILLDDALKDILSALKVNNDYAAVYGNIIYTTCYKGNMYYRCVKADINIENLRKGMICSHQGIVCRKSWMLEMGGFDCSYKIAGDWNLICNIYMAGGKLYFFDRYIAACDQNGVSAKSYIMEKHKVRKNNKFYKCADLYFIKDLFHDIKSVLSSKILGPKKIERSIRVNGYTRYDGGFRFFK